MWSKTKFCGEDFIGRELLSLVEVNLRSALKFYSLSKMEYKNFDQPQRLRVIQGIVESIHKAWVRNKNFSYRKSENYRLFR